MRSRPRRSSYRDGVQSLRRTAGPGTAAAARGEENDPAERDRQQQPQYPLPSLGEKSETSQQDPCKREAECIEGCHVDAAGWQYDSGDASVRSHRQRSLGTGGGGTRADGAIGC